MGARSPRRRLRLRALAHLVVVLAGTAVACAEALERHRDHEPGVAGLLVAAGGWLVFGTLGALRRQWPERGWDWPGREWQVGVGLLLWVLAVSLGATA